MGETKGVFVFWRRENMKRVDLGQGGTVRQQINKTFFLAIAVLQYPTGTDNNAIIQLLWWNEMSLRKVSNEETIKTGLRGIFQQQIDILLAFTFSLLHKLFQIDQ